MLRRVHSFRLIAVLFLCLTLPIAAALAETVSTSFEEDPDGNSRGQGATLIASVEIENSGTSGDVVVDDVSFTAGEPTGGGPLEDPIPESIPVGTEITLTTIASGLVAPNWGTYAPGDMTRLFVVDQTGILYAIDLSTTQSATFLDVSARLVALGISGPGSFDERGFLGMAAFHPDYLTNGLLYTYTSQPVAGVADFSTIPAGESANHQSVITEWQVPARSDPASVVDPDSARELLRIDQPQFNHDGGALEFDADGFLLIALGDGGAADDQGIGHVSGGNGQAPSNPFGALLRIDPLGNDSTNGHYGIPSTNPFVGQAGFLDEIFAYGFRNPFRIAFDAMSGDLFVADVGQHDIEEIDLVVAGENYGWNYKEGSFFFDPNGAEAGFVTDVDPGVPAGLVDPIAEYDHDEGIAIVGGFVYREGSVAALDGRYVFGDYGGPDGSAGRLFYLDSDNAVTEFDIRGRENLEMFLLGFGRDMAGNVYVLANDTGTPFEETGVVMRINSGPGDVAFTAEAASVSEDAGATVITVTRTGGDAGMATVDYATAADTATAGTDYSDVSDTLTWADGEAGDKTFEVPITDDSEDESAESFTATLSNASGADLGATSSITVTINDNDDPTPPPADDDDDDDGIFGIGSTGALSLLVMMGLIGLRYHRRARQVATAYLSG